MIEFVFEPPLETAEGELQVTLHFERKRYQSFQFHGATLRLVDADPDSLVELSPAFFWALLDEDAHIIYEAAIKHLQDNEQPKSEVNASGHWCFEFKGAEFKSVKESAMKFMEEVVRPERFLRFSAGSISGEFSFKIYYLGNPNEPVCD